MFGLKKDKKKHPFEFDLEKDLRQDSKKRTKVIDDISHRKQELKTLLREGAKSNEFEECGLLLQGYEALERVIDCIEKD